MKRDQRLLRTMGVAAGLALLLLLGFALAGAALLWSTLPPADRQAMVQALGDRLPLLVLPLLAAVGAAVALSQVFYRRWIAAPVRLLEQAQVLVSTDVQRTLALPQASADVQGLARAFNELAGRSATAWPR